MKTIFNFRRKIPLLPWKTAIAQPPLAPKQSLAVLCDKGGNRCCPLIVSFKFARWIKTQIPRISQIFFSNYQSKGPLGKAQKKSLWPAIICCCKVMMDGSKVFIQIAWKISLKPFNTRENVFLFCVVLFCFNHN